MIILALDDEPGALKLLTRAITAARTGEKDELYSFSNPEEAIALAHQKKVDVAFLDIQMPGITGFEVAKQLTALNSQTNIIFASGYGEYAMDAFSIHSSGYLLKPILKEDVAKEFANLRNHPIEQPANTTPVVMAKTFGLFDMFVNGKPIVFHKEKSKELMALLVDARGATLTRRAIAAVLFEDEPYSRSNQAYLSQIVVGLKQALAEAGCPELLLCEHNTYAVDTSLFDCDAYRYLDGEKSGFHGEYMNQYSWCEERIGIFYEDL